MIANFFKRIKYSIDWLLFGAMFFISIAGILTMNSFVDESVLFVRQIIWLAVSMIFLFGASIIDWRFLRRTESIVFVFISFSLVLVFLFIAGSVFKGARSWFDLGAFAFQPVDFAKIGVVLLL